jgi:ATP-binding cassette subfamily E protein 1
VVCHPQSVRVGVNIYLNGYIPDENVRFRDVPVIFHVRPPVSAWRIDDVVIRWPVMSKSYDGFTLTARYPTLLHNFNNRP